MKEKKVDKKKTLAYAVAFLLYGCIYQVHDGRYDVSMYIPFMTGGMITVV